MKIINTITKWFYPVYTEVQIEISKKLRPLDLGKLCENLLLMQLQLVREIELYELEKETEPIIENAIVATIPLTKTKIKGEAATEESMRNRFKTMNAKEKLELYKDMASASMRV